MTAHFVRRLQNDKGLFSLLRSAAHIERWHNFYETPCIYILILVEEKLAQKSVKKIFDGFGIILCVCVYVEAIYTYIYTNTKLVE